MNYKHKQIINREIFFYISASVLLAVFFCVFGLFNAQDTNAEEFTCDSCLDCSSKIQSAVSGNIIILTTDINDHDGTCIDFRGSTGGITFDGDDHFISGDNDYSGYGIRFYINSNNTIRNCEISYFSRGIYVYAGSNNIFQNIQCNSNHGNGIMINDSSSNTMDN